MKKVEKELLALIERKNKYDVRTDRQIEVLRKKLVESGLCKHGHARPYQWMHDDGYGRQKMLDGLRCDLCGFDDKWPPRDENGRLTFRNCDDDS